MKNTTHVTRRDTGSPDDFEKDWEEALAGKLDRHLIYPSDLPTTQFDLFELMKAKLVDDLVTRSGLTSGRVLEYGCGAAGMSIYFANQGFQAVACDLSARALQLANYNSQRHLSVGSEKNLTGVRADAFRLPFEDNTFDIVMSYGLLEHLASGPLENMLTEVTRVLRPGGLFVADIAHGRFSGRTIGIWISLCVSTIYHFFKLDWQRLPQLPALYLDHYYENDLDKHAWEAELAHAGLTDTQSMVCQPFPPLAVTGWAERLYVSLLHGARPVWNWYHRVQPTWGRNLGWLYLASGTKSKGNTAAE